jgi:hypothetical protein
MFYIHYIADSKYGFHRSDSSLILGNDYLREARNADDNCDPSSAIGTRNPPRISNSIGLWCRIISTTNSNPAKNSKASEMEVLQLCRSALISWADMVLAPSVAGLFKWRQFDRK